MRFIVLLSAGLDSTVNLFKAREQGEVALAITFDYGQKAASQEIKQSQKICGILNIPHQVVELPWLKQITKTALVDANVQVPSGKSVEIDNLDASIKTAKAVWVPNRNGVFLNIAASYAESLGADAVVPGFNREEASSFPDNSAEFILAVTQCLTFSTMSAVKVECFTEGMDKKEIVNLGRQLNVPMELIWPCYFSGPQICGECESCQRFLRAVE